MPGTGHDGKDVNRSRGLACAAHTRRSGQRDRPGACGRPNDHAYPDELPPAVAKKRDAIVAAARVFDYDGLEKLLDRKTCSYSFGESGDPVGYWRRLEDEGEIPILGDYLPVILGAPPARRGNTYVWPSAYGKSPPNWTAEDRQWLTNLYTEQEIRAFERAGGYLGWRAGIRDDGKWLFFVAGD